MVRCSTVVFTGGALALVASTTWPGSVPGAQASPVITRYVGPGGSDAGNFCRHPSTPCSTIAHAVQAAGANGVISVAAGIYNERSILVDTDVQIVGAGASVTVIDGQHSGNIFTVDASGLLDLVGISIENATTTDHGAAINNSGTLTVNRDRFINNRSTDPGGAINNYATITRADNDVFERNSTLANGGALENFGTIGPMNHDVFIRNHAGYGAGALDNQGEMGRLDEGIFANDSSGQEAGARVNDDFIGDLTGDTFAHNTSAGGIGGALENIFGSIDRVTDDTFADNVANTDDAYSEGGAILQSFASITTMADDTIAGNTATIGGGLDNENSTIGSMTGVVFAGNHAQQGPNCYLFAPDQGTITDGGHNLLRDTARPAGRRATSARSSGCPQLSEKMPSGYRLRYVEKRSRNSAAETPYSPTS